MIRFAPRPAVLTGAVLVGALAPGAHAGPVTYTTLAVTGQSAPGLTNITFDALADPRVDEFGRSVFWARLAGTGVTTSNDGSLWTTRSGALALLLREDGPVSGSGDLFVGLGSPAWNSLGRLGLTGSVGSGAFSFPTTFAQFIEGGSSLGAPAARESAQLPVLGMLALNDAGAALYRSGDGSAIFSTRAGPAAAIVKAGDPAPGASNPAATFAIIGQGAHNSLSDVAFWATVTFPGQTVPESGIWTDAGGLRLVARTGRQAPGQASGVVFAELDSTPRIDSSGGVSFWARLSGPGVTAANDGSVWRSAGGVTQIISREGTAAPGLSGLTVGQLARHVQQADSGLTLFWGTAAGTGVDGGNNGVIWSNDPVRGLAVVAREGDQVPGLPDGVLFATLNRPCVTPYGRVAFTASLRSLAGLPQTSTFALLATDGQNRLFPIARTGDAFTVSTGDVRTIAHVVFDPADAQTGYAQYSGSGQLAFKLAFANGSSALVTARIALCPADFDANGFANGDDFDLFSLAFQAASPSADVNGDGFVNGADFDYFITAFEGGC